MADEITREIEITAALSSDYQAAFTAASSIARSTASELSALTKRGADLARMTEIAGKAAEASAANDAAAVEKLQAQYTKLADKIGLADRSAEGLRAEIKRVNETKAGLEALNKSAAKSAEIGRVAREIQKYTAATQKIKDPLAIAHLDKLKTRFRELGGVIPDGKKSKEFFNSLKTGLATVPGPASGIARTLDASKGKLASFGAKAALLAGSVAAIKTAFKGAIASTAGKAALIIGGIAAIGAAAVKTTKAMWGLGRETIEVADQIAKTSRQLGIASDSYQELAYAVGLGGASEKDFDNALQQLNRQMESARSGNSKAAKAFEALGVSMKDVKSLNTEEMFIRLSDALSDVDDVAAKTKTTMTLFGDGGQKVATAIAGGSRELQRLRDEAKKSGYVMSSDALKEAEEANDNFTRSQMELRGAVRRLGVEAMPVINDALKDFIKIIRENRDVIAGVARLIGTVFSANMTVFLGTIKAVHVAFRSFIEGLRFWQGKFADFVGWVVDTAKELPGKIGAALKRGWNAVVAWFSDVKVSVSAWISDLVDSIGDAIMEKVAWIKESLKDAPIIGDLFEETESAQALSKNGNVQITVNTNVDARGAEPGAGAEISRAVRSVAPGAGESVAAAMSNYARLSYSGG